MTRLTHTFLDHLSPDALRHAKRIAQKHKASLGGKPDPDKERHADWIDKNGRFTIPRNKGK